MNLEALTQLQAAMTKQELVTRRADDIVPEKIDWLWPGRLARGKHTCIGGEPGSAKSQLTINVAAAITTGGLWPCGEGRAPLGSVIILSAEDGAADTIVPRLMAAGADLSKVHLISAVMDGTKRRGLDLQNDLLLLEQKIAEIGDTALAIIDPVSSYLGQKTDSHKNAEVRGVLEPLSEMGERTRVGILSITHFSKTSGTTKALHRFLGSIAFVGAPRAAFAVVSDADNEGRMLLLEAKNNIAAPQKRLAYRVEQTLVAGDIVASRISWESEHVSISVGAAMAAEDGGNQRGTAGNEAEEMLTNMLTGHPAVVADIKREATAAGISWRTMERAKARLKVRAVKSAMDGGWLWELPSAGQVERPTNMGGHD